MAEYVDRFFYLALFIITFSKLVYDIARDSFVGLSNNKKVFDKYLFNLEKDSC